MTNPWLALALLSLTTFILTKLVVDLDFPPVVWVRGKVIGGWQPLTFAQRMNPENDPSAAPGVKLMDGEPHWYRVRKAWIPLFFAELMSCPWCVSGWISAGAVGGTWLTAGLPAPVLMWPASWALGALLAQHDYA